MSSRYDTYLSLIPTVVKTKGFRALQALNKILAKQFVKKSAGSFNNGDKLRAKGGKLEKSFQLNDPNTSSKVDFVNNKLEFFFGSKLPYANIHDKGGIIKAKKKTKNSRGETVFAMEQFFLAKFKQTNERGFLFSAIKIRNKGFVEMKKRPYFDDTLKIYVKDEAPKINALLETELLKLWVDSE